MRSFVLFVLSVLSVSFSASAQSVIRTLAWELNTSRPALQQWQLVRGETVDLECRYLSGASAMDVRGAAVVLHCRTNGMAEGYSYQVTGSVGRAASTNLASVGWTTVRVRPDLDLPHNVKSVTFALETTLDSARNLVASGTLGLSGDPTGTAPASTPLYQYDAKGSAQAVSNALAGELHAVVTGLSGRVSSVSTAISNLSSAVDSVEALSQTNRVVRLHDGASGDPRWLILTGSNLQVRVAAATNAWHFSGGYDVLPLTHPLSLYAGGVWAVTGIADGSPADISCVLSSVNWSAVGIEIDATNFTMSGYSAELDSIVYTNVVYGPLPATNTVLSLSLDLSAELARQGVWSGIESASELGTNAQIAASEALFYADLAQGDINAHKNDPDAHAVQFADIHAAKELHADSFTNVIWRSIFSNGWHRLVAVTNTP